MSKLYAEVNSDSIRNTRTARGRQSLDASVNTWHSGVDVIANTDEIGSVVFSVYINAGSKEPHRRLPVVEFTVLTDGSITHLELADSGQDHEVVREALNAYFDRRSVR